MACHARMVRVVVAHFDSNSRNCYDLNCVGRQGDFHVRRLRSRG